MTSNTPNTDPRLLSIMESGQDFLAYIDPHGLLQPALVKKIIMDLHHGTWKILLSFETKNEMIVQGITKDNQPFIQNIETEPFGSDNIFRAKPAKSLAEAFGDLSRIPVHLKKYLTRNGLKNGLCPRKEENPFSFLPKAIDANFYKTEDTTPKSSKKFFRKWKINYFASKDGNVEQVEIVAIHKTKTSAITVSTFVDVYGLNNKTVTLTKVLGENRSALIDCTVKTGDKTVPSLKVAFDLDKKIPVMYFPEKRAAKKVKNSSK